MSVNAQNLDKYTIQLKGTVCQHSREYGIFIQQAAGISWDILQ